MFEHGREEAWIEPQAQPATSAPATVEPAFADIADGAPRRLDPRWVQAERLGGAIATLVLGGGSLTALILCLFFHVLRGPWSAVASAAWLLFAAWLVWGATVYPRLAYQHAAYTLSPRGIEIRRGVLWRHVIDVPRSRVQHTDVAEGPLERRFGLATLTIHTAGTVHHTVSQGGLDRATALRLRDFLVRGGRSDGV